MSWSMTRAAFVGGRNLAAGIERPGDRYAPRAALAASRAPGDKVRRCVALSRSRGAIVLAPCTGQVMMMLAELPK